MLQFDLFVPVCVFRPEHSSLIINDFITDFTN